VSRLNISRTASLTRAVRYEDPSKTSFSGYQCFCATVASSYKVSNLQRLRRQFRFQNGNLIDAIKLQLPVIFQSSFWSATISLASSGYSVHLFAKRFAFCRSAGSGLFVIRFFKRDHILRESTYMSLMPSLCTYLFNSRTKRLLAFSVMNRQPQDETQ
jgi:hypothetical protein